MPRTFKRPRGRVGRMWWDRAIQEALAIIDGRIAACRESEARWSASHGDSSRHAVTERSARLEAELLAERIANLAERER